MYPILYEKTEKDFNHLGLGVLTDAITCTVEETRNGIFELNMEYPIEGLHYEKIEEGRYIKADAGHKLKEQRFKIIRIAKKKHTIKVYAEHISYRASECNIKPLVNTGRVNGQQALQVWKNNQIEPNDFEVYSDISTIAETTWSIEDIENARQALGGKRGSILDVWGGEYEFDNNKINLWSSRGKDSQTLIAYGRNIIDIEQEERIDSTFTSVYPYYVSEEHGEAKKVITLQEYFVDSEHVNKYRNRNILTLNMSEDFKKPPTEAQLRAKAQSYIKANNLGIPSISIKVKIQDLSKTLEYKELKEIESLNLCDKAIVKFEKLGIDTEAKVVGVKWNVLKEEYDELTFGSTKRTIGDVISNVVDYQITESEEKISRIAYKAANGLNIVFKGEEEPKNPKPGDLWYKLNGPYIEMYVHNGEIWGLQMSTEHLEDAGRLRMGTIDAGQIRVINLDAANMTTGTLRGGQVIWDLDQGTFLIGNSTEDYRMWYDGQNLRMGSSTVSREALTDEVLGEIDGKVSTQTFEVANNQLKSELTEQITSGDQVVSDKVSTLTHTVDGLRLAQTQHFTDVEGRIVGVEQNFEVANGQLRSDIRDNKNNISNLTQTATSLTSQVSSKVGKNEVISTINQTAELVRINANRIDLSGFVSVTQLSTGGYVTKGMMGAGSGENRAYLNPANVHTGQIPASTVKTSSSTLNYLHVHNQWIDFYRDSLCKMSIGFVSGSSSSSAHPQIILGAGNGRGDDVGRIYKDDSRRAFYGYKPIGITWLTGMYAGNMLRFASSAGNTIFSDESVEFTPTGAYITNVAPNGSHYSNQVGFKFANNAGIYFDSNGHVDFCRSGATVHRFYSNGSKDGGSIEVDGKNLGMSPVDSPQILLEDLYIDIEATEEGTKVMLNDTFKKTIAFPYAVFCSNGAECTEKNINYFIIKGNSKTDITVKGKRIGFEDIYYRELEATAKPESVTKYEEIKASENGIIEAEMEDIRKINESFFRN